MRFFFLVSSLALALACSGDETEVASSGATSGAQTGSGAGSQGGGGAAQGGQGGSAQAIFSCRDMIDCVQGQEYCMIFHPGVRGADPVYTCEPLPKTCDPVECKCLRLDVTCMCQQSAAGDLQVTCMGA